ARLVRDSGTTVVQVGEGADEHFLGYWWCEHYRRLYESVYQPARQRQPWWRRIAATLANPRAAVSTEALEVEARARHGEELFWGGAVCWWGERRRRLTPDRKPFAQDVECPVPGLLPPSHHTLDSHAVVSHYIGTLTGHLVEPEVLQKMPYMEMRLRLSEHLLMRVDKLTMAHSVEARVPFLDHDVVEFATKLPPSYKLSDSICKKILKKTAEPYLDHDMIYRQKQGFGAPMDEWFREGDFGARCLAAFERSALRKERFFDDQYFISLLKDQIAGRQNVSFPLWTVMNAILWHASWVEGREDCL
ncbi:MAG TPA: asparagine synthase-related protein, partial [Vicinamibacterales bacterium]|nr:asparagine synthase-related protein [Vicinamibacterales bacterium]